MKKSVRFSGNVAGCYIKTATEEEIPIVYYSREEYSSMIEESSKIIRRLDMDFPVDSNSTARGLEHLTSRGRKRVNFQRMHAFRAVMDEQQQQWEEEIFDEDAIAQAYAVYGKHCQRAASKRGMKDAEEIRGGIVSSKSDEGENDLEDEKGPNSSISTLGTSMSLSSEDLDDEEDGLFHTMMHNSITGMDVFNLWIAHGKRELLQFWSFNLLNIDENYFWKSISSAVVLSSS